MKIGLLILFLLLNSDLGICKIPNYIKDNYCIVNDSYNEMGLMFKIKKDTIFLFYINIIDNGNYINGYVDDNDYAGFFISKSIKNNQVSFRIKNYRDESHKYTVRLKFMNDGKKCVWEILTKEPVGYLPKNAIFRNCK